MNESSPTLMLPAPDLSRWIFYRRNTPCPVGSIHLPRPLPMDPQKLERLNREIDKSVEEFDRIWNELFGSDFPI